MVKEDIKEIPYDELFDIAGNSFLSENLREIARLRISRIQQDTNNTQIGQLLDITKENILISKRNAESDNRLARWAIRIAVASFLAQVIFSTVEVLWKVAK